MKKLLNILLLLATLVTTSQQVFAHCQIPCGIYDDHARVNTMLEDVSTIEKSVKLIGELSGKSDSQSNNQLIRWAINKEKHAQNIISTISGYFLTQRVKSKQKDYKERLIHHHTVIVAAMKVKQTADLSYVKKLKTSVNKLLSYYPEHKH